MTPASSLKVPVLELTPEEFVRLPHSPQLIDVRSGWEYTLFHAPNAINLSLPRILMGRLPMLRTWLWPNWFRALPKTEAIAIICLTAHRSPLAAQQLTQAGFTKVFNITGGMMAWQKADLPICRGRNTESID
ncbi:MAG: rhodanese-like domain-containing protein [Leptolyngbya sp. SIO1D8]|nr:rhodanese-like domain-containing protein [Leptolyngbya sp. SIO1D8]